jgi:uncharacterized YigZ family protein
MKDNYLTIKKATTGEFKDRGSKFIAYAHPVNSESDFAQFAEIVRKEHPKARHHCYAWRLGLDQNQFRANDDGEPSGTAGRPILGQIDRLNLTNIGIIVVRYFGGTLLGTSGLINAYRASAADALVKSEVIEKILEDIIQIQFDYEWMPAVMNAVKKLQINVLRQDFNEIGVLQISIRKQLTEETLLKMKALILKITVEEVLLLKEIKGIKIIFEKK